LASLVDAEVLKFVDILLLSTWHYSQTTAATYNMATIASNLATSLHFCQTVCGRISIHGGNWLHTVSGKKDIKSGEFGGHS